MSVGIKSRCANDVGTRQRTLTIQARQEKPRPGFPGRSCTSSVAATRHKPTATSHGCSRLRRDLARGHVTSDTALNTTQATTIDAASTSRIAANPDRIFFSLKAGRSLHVGGAEAPPHGGLPGRPRRLREVTNERSSGGGLQAPSPASHHVGVIGGALGHHITPSRCEAGREVIGDV